MNDIDQSQKKSARRKTTQIYDDEEQFTVHHGEGDRSVASGNKLGTSLRFFDGLQEAVRILFDEPMSLIEAESKNWCDAHESKIASAILTMKSQSYAAEARMHWELVVEQKEVECDFEMEDSLIDLDIALSKDQGVQERITFTTLLLPKSDHNDLSVFVDPELPSISLMSHAE